MGTVTPLFRKKKAPVLELDNARNTLMLGLSAIMLFSIEDAPPMLQNSSCCFGRNTLFFDEIAACLNNSKQKKQLLDEFIKMLYRFFVQEVISIVEDYCDRSGQNGILRQQQWYPFARAIKSSLAGGFVFTTNDPMPVRWRDKVITVDMSGETLLSSFFDFDDAWDLAEEIRIFADALD